MTTDRRTFKTANDVQDRHGGLEDSSAKSTEVVQDRQEPESGGLERRRALRRSADRERQAAELLGTTRVKRSRFESAPDLPPVRLPCGLTLMPEVKTRRRLPALVTKALDQAKGYAPPGAIPVAVLSATGAEPVIVLPLRAFRRIAGIENSEPTPQVPIAFPTLGADELRVVEAVAVRLAMGAGHYGPLQLDVDPRDWREEAAEELLDACAYLACALLRRRPA